MTDVFIICGSATVASGMAYDAKSSGAAILNDYAYGVGAALDAGVKLVTKVVLAMSLRRLGIDIFSRAFV